MCKLVKFVVLFCLCYRVIGDQFTEIESDDFAEFNEDIDDLHDRKVNSFEQPKVQQDVHENVIEKPEVDAIVEDFEDDDDDDDDFETEQSPVTTNKVDREIIINEKPISFRKRWLHFWFECLLLSGLVIFLINFVISRETNCKIAKTWFSVHKSLLKSNFHLVAENGVGPNSEAGPTSQDIMVCESENFYSLWCSGRICCEGMLIELKLLKRQDLINRFIGYLMRVKRDKVRIKVMMKKQDMDTFIVCLATKKTATNFSKKMNDLISFGLSRKTGDKFYISNNFNVFSEINEVTSAIFDPKVVSTIHRFKDCIEFIHISDQYSGFKNTEDNTSQTLQLPETEKVIIFEYNLPSFSNDTSISSTIESVKPLMGLLFQLIDKVKKLRLSKEARAKADKNRARIEQEFLKTTHAARAEAAAARREEKRRSERERVMMELDPERQRKWEEKDQRRQLKKRAPKMRLFKIKSV